LLRSSSMREPRYPLPRVVWIKISSLHRERKAGRPLHRARQYKCSLTPKAPWVLLRPLRPVTELGGLVPGRSPAARETRSRSVLFKGHDNDPSAGSPTETLLRLLLPLNDKVQWTSRDVGGGEPPPSPRSEHFTGPFNR
jgi:hypothetical protein